MSTNLAQRQPITINGKVIRCPDDTGPKGATEIIGCGSTNITGPDREGLYDCLECGIWFDRDEALSYLDRIEAQQQKA